MKDTLNKKIKHYRILFTNFKSFNKKGQSKMVFMVAMLVLAVMFIVLWYVFAEEWLTELSDDFMNIIE